METNLITTKGVNNNVSNYRKTKDIVVSHAAKTSPYLKRSTFWWVYNTITSTVKKKAVEAIRNEPDKVKLMV